MSKSNCLVISGYNIQILKHLIFKSFLKTMYKKVAFFTALRIYYIENERKNLKNYLGCIKYLLLIVLLFVSGTFLLKSHVTVIVVPFHSKTQISLLGLNKIYEQSFLSRLSLFIFLACLSKLMILIVTPSIDG